VCQSIATHINAKRKARQCRTSQIKGVPRRCRSPTMNLTKSDGDMSMKLRVSPPDPAFGRMATVGVPPPGVASDRCLAESLSRADQDSLGCVFRYSCSNAYVLTFTSRLFCKPEACAVAVQDRSMFGKVPPLRQLASVRQNRGFAEAFGWLSDHNLVDTMMTTEDDAGRRIRR
jgi:hypothetical protein